MRRQHPQYRLPRVDVLPLVDCVFQLIIFFLVTIKFEAKLDDILKLPAAYKSVVQEQDKLQIYILKPVILPDGRIDPDSTGLIAFAPKEAAKDDPRRLESRFVSLDSVDERLEREWERAWKLKVAEANFTNAQKKPPQPPISDAAAKRLKDAIPLMVKADRFSFYGRILEVVAKARQVGIQNFAFVTASETSEEFTGRKGKK